MITLHHLENSQSIRVLWLLEELGLSQAIPSMIEKVTAAGGTVTDDDRLLFEGNKRALREVAEAVFDVPSSSC